MLLYDDYASYYPLCPPLADVPLDSCCLKQTLFPEYTPDILILPSDMREFVKNVRDVLCINPGRICRGRSAGTYVRFTVHADKNANAQDTDTEPSRIVTRTRVDIIKF